MVYNAEELAVYEEKAVAVGYEGVMVRSLSGEYKHGRSTAKQGILGKVKRFSDYEAVVIGFEEKMHNTNDAKTNELGRTQRSTAKEGLVGANTLGSLTVEKDGVIFNVGSGFNDAQRKEIWEHQSKYLGSLVKYKCFDVQSGYEAPRFPIFLGFRDKDDL
jgi:DNA ligase-1